MSDRTLSKGLHPSVRSVCVARPEIGAYHVEFARQKLRAGVGWQAIAHMLGVNRETLRGAVEARATVGVAPAEILPAIAAEGAKKRTSWPDPHVGSLHHLILAELMAEASVRVSTLPVRLDREALTVNSALSLLRNRGWIDDAEKTGHVEATRIGCEVFARVEAAKHAADARALAPKSTGPQSRGRVLATLARGATYSGDLAAQLGLRHSDICSALAKLERAGLAKRGAKFGRSYLWTITAAGEAEAKACSEREAAHG